MPLGQSRLHIRGDAGRNSSKNWLSIIFTLIFWFKGKVEPDGWYNIQLENSFLMPVRQFLKISLNDTFVMVYLGKIHYQKKITFGSF